MPKTLVNSVPDSCQAAEKKKNRNLANIRREQTEKNKSNLHLYEKVLKPGNLYAPRDAFLEPCSLTYYTGKTKYPRKIISK